MSLQMQPSFPPKNTHGFCLKPAGSRYSDTRNISRFLGSFHKLDTPVRISATHLHGKSVRKNCRSTRGVRSKSCVVGQFVCSGGQADVMRQFLHLTNPQILLGSFGFDWRPPCLPASWFPKSFGRGNPALAKKRKCVFGGKASPTTG